MILLCFENFDQFIRRRGQSVISLFSKNKIAKSIDSVYEAFLASAQRHCVIEIDEEFFSMLVRAFTFTLNSYLGNELNQEDDFLISVAFELLIDLFCSVDAYRRGTLSRALAVERQKVTFIFRSNSFLLFLSLSVSNTQKIDSKSLLVCRLLRSILRSGTI